MALLIGAGRLDHVEIVIGSALVVAFALWTVVAPRHQWQLLNARRRDPDAAEPTGLSYFLARGAGLGTIILVLMFAGVLLEP